MLPPLVDGFVFRHFLDQFGNNLFSAVDPFISVLIGIVQELMTGNAKYTTVFQLLG
mgnify:CR=1 FL=1